MGNIKNELQKVYEECTNIYYKGGASAVHDHVIKQQDDENPMYMNVQYRHCTACDSGQPTLNNICLVCGSKVDDKIVIPLNIDWNALQKQKDTLVEVISKMKFEPIVDDLNGIVHLLDALQDKYEPKKKIIGFQVVDIDNNIHPDMGASFCVYSLSQAKKMLNGKSRSLLNKLDDWYIKTILENDIEELIMMFEGDPRQ